MNIARVESLVGTVRPLHRVGSLNSFSGRFDRVKTSDPIQEPLLGVRRLVAAFG